jgi:hypothetical protein
LILLGVLLDQALVEVEAQAGAVDGEGLHLVAVEAQDLLDDLLLVLQGDALHLDACQAVHLLALHAGSLAEHEDLGGVDRGADVHAGVVGRVAPGGLGPALLVGTGELAVEQHDGWPALQLLEDDLDLGVDVGVELAADVLVDAGHEAGEHEDGVGGVAVVAVDVAAVVRVHPGVAVGDDLLVALLGRPGGPMHGHLAVH